MSSTSSILTTIQPAHKSIINVQSSYISRIADADLSYELNDLSDTNGATHTSTDEAYGLMNGLDDPEDFPDGGCRAWLVVLGSSLGLVAVFGLMNSVGTVQSYISLHQLAGNSISTISWIFSIYSFMSYFATIVTGPIFDKYGSRIPMIIGTLCFCGSIFITGEDRTVYQFILSFGLLNGIGYAFLVPPLIGVISHWFVKRRASALGLATIGGSVGGIISPLILRSLYPNVGFKWAMRILSFMYLGFLVIALVLIKDRVGETNHHAQSTEYNDHRVEDKSSLAVKVKNILTSSVDLRIMKNKKYCFFVFALILSDLSLILTLTYLASYCLAQGQSESTTFLLLTILNSAGVVGRIVPGYLADRYGTFNVIAFCSFFVALSIFLIWFPFGHKLGALYAFVVIYGLSSASVLSLSPACCSKLVQAKDFGKAYGTAYFFVSFVNLVGLVLASLVIGKGDIEGYNHLVLLIALLAVVATIFWIVARYFVGGSNLYRRC